MNSLKCPSCGLVNFATAAACKRCQGPLDASAPRTAPGAAPSPAASRPADGLYYKPSGEVPLAGALGGLLAGLACGVPLAFVYSYLVYYIPLIYLNVLCTVGFAALLGFVPGYVMHLAKVRNVAACVGVAVIAALVSYYVSWAVWVSVIASNEEASVSALDLASQPGALWAMVLRINELGAWSLFRTQTPVSGLGLWVVWAIEAGIILIGAPIAAAAMLGDAPFCEGCKVWCSCERGVALLGQAEEGELRRRVEAKDFQYVRGLGAKSEQDVEWFRVDLYRCPSCGQTNALSVLKEKLKFDEKGNASVSSSAFIENLLLTVPEADDLRALNRDLAPSAPAYA